ncbi:glycerol-3-phosphate dehydrogenase [Litorivivens lipolytica]|uniref:Glycerol-3-phosphate dehydrogenase n=1 Tax=Litorivivens lipolytica TaxID=1524264 RepID=A0A7W4W4Z0_9GAMM|nr:FAD-dependent oxidoreductase [Litorivivens lipolytica]MBB3047571.1 glycerol-3-phosphate dehydrogenase [Litorivivens lipolytica]
MLTTEVAVIGGGIQGAGVAQAAAAAGYEVMLFEKSGWGAATSSSSSKLIHGGLRYLESGDIKLVYENLAERELLLRNAPELVKPTPFYIPVYKNSTRPAWQIQIGLLLYRLLARFTRTSEFHRLDPRAWRYLDSLQINDLRAVFQYWDAQTDDRLLTRAVVKSAMELGAKAFCPAELVKGEALEDGYKLLLKIKGKPVYCHAKTVVNAAGPWVNEVQERLDSTLPQADITLVRGSHIVIPGTLVKGIYYLQSPIDNRPLFAMPWRDNILVGTTEAEHTGSLDEISASPAEIDYLQRSFAHHFPGKNTEVLESFAGVRVLPTGDSTTNKRSRETIFVTDLERAVLENGSADHGDEQTAKEKTARTLAIYGGKLTGYRLTGEKALEKLRPTLGEREPVADTRSLTIKPA